MTTQAISDEIAIIRHELELIEAGVDTKTSAATVRQAAYTISRVLGALDHTARLTHSNGRLDDRYRTDH